TGPEVAAEKLPAYDEGHSADARPAWEAAEFSDKPVQGCWRRLRDPFGGRRHRPHRAGREVLLHPQRVNLPFSWPLRATAPPWWCLAGQACVRAVYWHVDRTLRRLGAPLPCPDWHVFVRYSHCCGWASGRMAVAMLSRRGAAGLAAAAAW